MIGKGLLAKEFAKASSEQGEPSLFKFSFAADIEKEKKKIKKKKKKSQSSRVDVDETVSVIHSAVDCDNDEEQVEDCVKTESAPDAAAVSSLPKAAPDVNKSITTSAQVQLSKPTSADSKSKPELIKLKKEKGTLSNNPPSSPPKSKKTASKGAPVDEEDRFLDEMIKLAQQEKNVIAKQRKADLKAGTVSGPGPRFQSHKDPELSEEEMKTRKFGKGKNLSVIGPPKRKDSGWLANRCLGGGVGVSESRDSFLSTSHGPHPQTQSTARDLHSSPFTFGFNHSNYDL
jgi:hypothetical protein